jgi:hypothetical protein
VIAVQTGVAIVADVVDALAAEVEVDVIAVATVVEVGEAATAVAVEADAKRLVNCSGRPQSQIAAFFFYEIFS